MLGLALLGMPSAVQSAPTVGRLPSCDLRDWMTVPRGYDDWSMTLVDRSLRVERDYVPPDLVPSSRAGLPGGGRIRAVAVADTRAMGAAARRAGAAIGVWSGYRSYKEQVGLFSMYSNANGFESAITYSQRPGHSEHQLGLGVDFMSAGGGNPLPGDWGATPAGAWMRANSWKYGWINSYPRGEGGTRWNDKTCFRYEPWHYRYLGREMAGKVHRSGLSIREYLWKHHVRLDRNGKPVPLATPTVTAPATPTATPTSTPGTSTTASSPSTASQPPATSSTAVSAGAQPTSSSGAGGAVVLGIVGGVLALGAAAALVGRRLRRGA